MTATTQLTTPSSQHSQSISGKVQDYLWNWQGQQVQVVYETLGQGTPVLLLPSFSTVSTRGEMAGVASLLAAQFQVIAIDWPGFGQSSRLHQDYKPAL